MRPPSGYEVRNSFIAHFLTSAVLSCAGRHCGKSWRKSGGCRGETDSFQKRSSGLCAHSAWCSDHWIPQQTWPLPREDTSPQSLWRPQTWPGAFGCANKGMLASRLYTYLTTEKVAAYIGYYDSTAYREFGVIHVWCFQDRGANSTWEITQGKQREQSLDSDSKRAS